MNKLYDKTEPNTTQFPILNFNLKKIIFSYLNLHDQRTIYWMNKKLRPLLPDSPLKIIKYSIKKCSSYKFEDYLNGILELNSGNISCFTTEGIKLLKLRGNKLILIESFPLKTSDNTSAIQQGNGNIIYISGYNLTILDENFNLIEKYEESSWIRSLCSISDHSFAIGLSDGRIKIYSKINSTKYHFKEYKYHSSNVWSLLYLPKQNYLLSGSYETMNVLNLSDEKSIKKLTDRNHWFTSIILPHDETFASSSKREIKIWSFKKESDFSIECICKKTIDDDDEEQSYDSISLHLFTNDFLVSRSNDEFKIWDLKNYECLKTYFEDSFIERLIVTKNKSIITVTKNEVNVWKILI
jgi:hypothetical protein